MPDKDGFLQEDFCAMVQDCLEGSSAVEHPIEVDDEGNVTCLSGGIYVPVEIDIPVCKNAEYQVNDADSSVLLGGSNPATGSASVGNIILKSGNIDAYVINAHVGPGADETYRVLVNGVPQGDPLILASGATVSNIGTTLIPVAASDLVQLQIISGPGQSGAGVPAECPGLQFDISSLTRIPLQFIKA